MKEIVGLLVFLAIGAGAIILAVKDRIGNNLATILLIFSLVSGWGIANYDWLQRLEWQVPGFAPFQKRVQTIEEGAVRDIHSQAEAEKASINLLISSAKEAHEDLGARKESIESLLSAVAKLEESVKAQEQKATELNEKARKMEDELVAIHDASSQLALLLTRVTWLEFEANDEYGAERAQIAVQKIMDGLDEIVGLVIKDPKARQAYISDVMSSLPPRQQPQPPQPPQQEQQQEQQRPKK